MPLERLPIVLAFPPRPGDLNDGRNGSGNVTTLPYITRVEMIKDGICRHARNHDTYHNQNSICVMHNYRNYYTPAIEIGGVL